MVGETNLTQADDKTWLETHLWHAKRMKMSNMWGYRLVRFSSFSQLHPNLFH
jgi:hypothetical protein